MELSKIAKITQILLYVFLCIGTVSLIFINKVVSILELPNPTRYVVITTLIGICCLYIVFEVTKVFKSIVLGNPFVEENEKALKRIAICCEIIAIILIVKLFVNTSIFLLTTLLLTVIFIIAGLCAYVFSQLFKQSVFLKEENDMTI